MNYGSVCSGIEAATVAWEPLGWNAAFYSEIEPFPSAVLAHHYPNVANLSDMTKFKEWPDATLDVLVGGTPCQSFSVAGLRKGLDDPRGNLMLTYGAIADKYRPRWLVWENVPGVLSSNGGRDFGTFLGMLGQLGYGSAYRVLDAQYFGVAQRRRRVFVVGYLGDWRRAAAVLFERHSLQGHSAPSREKGQTITGPITAGISKGMRGTEGVDGGWMVPQWPAEIACLNASYGDKQGLEDQHINQGAPLFVPANVSIGIDEEQNAANELMGCLKARTAGGGFEGSVMTPAMQVRRLTPVECERLQGFPDDYTNIPWRGKSSATDGPRYKALGNSMAVPVMAWIGRRIQQLEEIA